MTLGELTLELQHELLDDRLHRRRRQRLERDDGVEPVAELRAEDPFDGGLRLVVGAAVLAKPIDAALISREPAFEVRISTVFRKSALRPVLSVSVA